jgi:hypothetical protein
MRVGQPSKARTALGRIKELQAEETNIILTLEREYPKRMPPHLQDQYERAVAREGAYAHSAYFVKAARVKWTQATIFVAMCALAALLGLVLSGCGPAEDEPEPERVPAGTCVIMREGGGFYTMPPPC